VIHSPIFFAIACFSNALRSWGDSAIAIADCGTLRGVAETMILGRSVRRITFGDVSYAAIFLLCLLAGNLEGGTLGAAGGESLGLLSLVSWACCATGVALLNMIPRTLSAAICSPPQGSNGDVGRWLVRA